MKPEPLTYEDGPSAPYSAKRESNGKMEGSGSRQTHERGREGEHAGLW